MVNSHIIKIALADDHTILRNGLAGLLKSMGGFDILFEADNGLELLSQLKMSAVMPDVCIIDINMPEMNGFETTAAIRSQYSQVKILALSMYDSEFSIIKMLRAGAHGYLMKNVRPAELRRAIETVHEHGVFYSDIVTGRKIRALYDDNSDVLNINQNEAEFLSLCCSEYTYKEIAEKMFKSPRTIDGYREDLFLKLGVSSRTGLVLYAIRAGIIRF